MECISCVAEACNIADFVAGSSLSPVNSMLSEQLQGQKESKLCPLRDDTFDVVRLGGELP